MKDTREFTNYKNTLGRYNLLMLATVGSKVLGLNSDNSDVDEMGICVESRKQLLGFAPFEHEVYRTAHDRTGRFDAPSEAGDIDLTVYGLRKFMKMSLSGNPNLITLLYLPKEYCSVYTALAEELQGIAKHLVSKQVLKAFVGYSRAQKLKLKGERGGMDVNRRGLVERYGYDIKYAMHMVRLGFQGREFAEKSRLSFPITGNNLRHLSNIKNGEYTLNDVTSLADENERRLEAHIQDGQFPEKPNYEAIEDWLLSIYEREWSENKTTPQQYRLTTNSEGQDAGAGKENGPSIGDDLPF